MRQTILDVIAAIERDEAVRVLYACESGSRAWGFESTDSDWDVRFLFCHPRDSYLSVDQPREQVERKLESAGEVLDVVGWDLPKTLRLLRKSNPSLVEWLHSPIRYVEREPESSELRALAVRAFSPIRSAYHYASMARSNDAAVLRAGPVRRKKYFYMLRTTLAHQWAVQRREIPPVLFERLFEELIPASSSVYAEVQELLQRKRAGLELGDGPRLPHLHAFLEQAETEMTETLRKLSAEDPEPIDAPTTVELDQFFRRAIERMSSEVV